ncbi:MAG: argininosuccinate lyase [Nitrososphaeria archaeon]
MKFLKKREEEMVDLLRGRRLEDIDPLALDYTASIKQDAPLLNPVIAINKAHIISLFEAGLLEREKASQILKALDVIQVTSLDTRVEDVHMFVEQLVKEKVGSIGGFLNLGKSRNDQVSTAIRIVVRESILDLIVSLINLTNLLQLKAAENIDKVMPSYTHLQVAQPITAAHWLLAYENMLKRDIDRLFQNYERVNSSPMGAAACAGTTLNLDRYFEAELLGFNSVVANSLDAVSSRDFLLEYMWVLSSIMLTISRMSEDINFMCNNEVGVIKVPDAYSSTSSAMPQKKNSVVTEISRASSAMVASNLFGAMCVYKGLPLSYNLDLQEITPKAWESYERAKKSLEVFTRLLAGLEFDEKRGEEVLIQNFSTAMELAEYITIKVGVPFRDAHHLVGSYIKRCIENRIAPASKNAYEVLVEELGKYTSKVMRFDDYLAIIDPKGSVIKKTIYGAPTPSNTEKMIEERRQQNLKYMKAIEQERERLGKASSMLEDKVKKIIGGEKS